MYLATYYDNLDHEAMESTDSGSKSSSKAETKDDCDKRKKGSKAMKKMSGLISCIRGDKG